MQVTIRLHRSLAGHGLANRLCDAHPREGGARSYAAGEPATARRESTGSLQRPTYMSAARALASDSLFEYQDIQSRGRSSQGGHDHGVRHGRRARLDRGHGHAPCRHNPAAEAVKERVAWRTHSEHAAHRAD